MHSSHEVQCRPSGLRSIIGDEIAGVCTDRFRGALRAVILHGSVARDEWTYVRDSAGTALLSDVDAFVVFRDECSLPARPAIGAAEQAIQAALAGKRIGVTLGLAPVNETFLRSLPHHIQTYELRACGKVICGDDGVLSLIPDFEATRISREDAWRLLCNRIIECLEALALADGDFASTDVVYRTVKLCLDMATSYLVFAGRYAPTYRGRERALRECTGQGCDAPFSLADFAATVSASTAFKLDGSELLQSPTAFWRDAADFAHRLWRWELRQLCGGDTAASDTESLERWMARQPVTARLRGWASVVRRVGVIRAAAESPRWLRFAWKASPRYWTYSVATQVFFQLPAILSPSRGSTGFDNWTGAIACLPSISGRPLDSVSSFRWTARLIAQNYHDFLETTTA